MHVFVSMCVHACVCINVCAFSTECVAMHVLYLHCGTKIVNPIFDYD